MSKEWLSIYPETNHYIWQYDQIDWKHKIELWFAANKMLSAAKVFNSVINFQSKIRHKMSAC